MTSCQESLVFKDCVNGFVSVCGSPVMDWWLASGFNLHLSLFVIDNAMKSLSHITTWFFTVSSYSDFMMLKYTTGPFRTMAPLRYEKQLFPTACAMPRWPFLLCWANLVHSIQQACAKSSSRLNFACSLHAALNSHVAKRNKAANQA